MNPRQRRGVLLIGAAALGALVVFVTILTYVSSVSAEVGNKVQVLRLSQDVQAYQEVTTEMVEVVELPERWVSSSALTDVESVIGQVAASAYAEGTDLQQGMLVASPSVERGSREIAMLVDARTGVAGKVRPGDRVDIIATSAFEEREPRAEVIVQNALVIDVGSAAEGQDEEPSELVPVTFAVPVQEALRVSYAESFAAEVRLALRGSGDDANVNRNDSIFGIEGVGSVR